MIADIWRSLSSCISFRLLSLLHIGSWQLSDKRGLQELNKMFTLRVFHTKQTCAEAHIQVWQSFVEAHPENGH